MARSRVPRPRLEKVEQQQIVDLLTTLGATTYVLGTRRSRGKPCPSCGTFVTEHQGTRQTPGISDIFTFLPARPHHTTTRVLLVIEAKSETGRLRPEQRAFLALCADAAIAHVVGTLDAVIAWLIEGGWLSPHSVPHYRLPASLQQKASHV